LLQVSPQLGLVLFQQVQLPLLALRPAVLPCHALEGRSRCCPFDAE